MLRGYVRQPTDLSPDLNRPREPESFLFFRLEKDGASVANLGTREGAMYRAILASLVLMFVVFTLVPAASAEKRVALVIGNLSYQRWQPCPIRRTTQSPAPLSCGNCVPEH